MNLKILEHIEKCGHCNNQANYLWITHRFTKLHWIFVCNECRLKYYLEDKPEDYKNNE